MQLNSNQTKTELRDWQASQPLKIIQGYTQLAVALCPYLERVYMDCQDSKQERREGSVTVDVSGLRVLVLILPISKQMPHSC